MNKKLHFEVASSIYSRITDGTHDSPEPQSHGKPLITSKHIKGREIDFDSAYLISEEDFTKINERSKVDKWDVIVSMIGEYCGFCYVERNDDIDYAVKNVGLYKTGSKLEAEWLYYYLNSPIGKGHLNSIKSGSSQPYLTLGGLRSLPILQPQSTEEKSQIVNILSSIDSKISLNNRINAELEAMAKTIYDYWFVQFDFPMTREQAKAIGKPAAAGKPYKASGGKMVWSEELKREVPEGWEIISLGEKIDFQRGISYKGSELDDNSGTPMINLNSFNLNGTYKPDGLKYFTGKYSDKGKTSTSDLLIAATDVTRNAEIIGKAILVPSYYSGDLVYSMDIAKIIPKNGMTSSYLLMLFNSEHYHNYIKYYASGTLVLHLNIDGVRWYRTEIPDPSLLSKYHEIYLPIAERISATQKENQKLTELRDWLLPMLMNGQIKIKDAERELAMAAEPEGKYTKK